MEDCEVDGMLMEAFQQRGSRQLMNISPGFMAINQVCCCYVFVIILECNKIAKLSVANLFITKHLVCATT